MTEIASKNNVVGFYSHTFLREVRVTGQRQNRSGKKTGAMSVAQVVQRCLQCLSLINY